MEDFGKLSLGNQVNFKINLFPQVIDFGSPVLRYQNKNGKYDRFKGNDHRQKSVGKGVERFYTREFSGIQKYPDGKEGYVYDQKYESSEIFCQKIRYLF